MNRTRKPRYVMSFKRRMSLLFWKVAVVRMTDNQTDIPPDLNPLGEVEPGGWRGEMYAKPNNPTAMRCFDHNPTGRAWE